MKLRILIISCILCAFLPGCVNREFDPDTWDTERYIFIRNSSVAFSSAAGVDTVEVNTDYRSFSAYVKYDDYAVDDWCTLSIDEAGKKVVVSVSANVSTQQRSATVCIQAGHGSRKTIYLPVVQTGGVWDVIGGYALFLAHDITQSQKDILSGLLKDMVPVSGGTFFMGEDETYSVTLDDFIIGRYEVTQEQWLCIMGSNPSMFRGDRHPVDNISWEDALEFCRALSSLTNLTFTLPTEAQWEYAARGGNLSYGYKYSGSDDYKKVAHFVGDYVSQTNPIYGTAEVGSKLPNELGLYDMSGNVSEYCMDFYADDYPVGSYVNPSGPSTGKFHVERGGYFVEYTFMLEVTARTYHTSHSGDLGNGMRIILCK